MNNMIDPSGRQTPEFDDMVDSVVNTWIRENNRLNKPSEFIVMAVQDKSGRVTFWGVLDAVTLPEEDLFTEMRLRFYCGIRTIGQESVSSVGVMDIKAVIDRVELPLPPRA